jgi:hypothetical protein
MKFQLELTGSQLMALRTVLVEAIRLPGGITAHVDCSQDPPVETKPEDLLTLTMNARAVKETSDA